MMKQKLAKKITKFRPRIRSRHPSHSCLRKDLPLLPFRSIVRMGSTTVDNTPGLIEFNSIQSVQNSANKLKMKTKFTEAKVKTADWWRHNGVDFTLQENEKHLNEGSTPIYGLPYPIVAKNIFGSRGTGNTLLHTQQELEAWLQGKNLDRYIFEKYYNYNKEYRLHVSRNGCFYTCRKVLIKDTPEKDKWFRNDKNCNWILETSELFEKPSSWDKIVSECVKALNAVGLDAGACDVRVQSELDAKDLKRKDVDFVIIEINSAPSFGDVTKQKYLEEIPKVLKAKFVEK